MKRILSIALTALLAAVAFNSCEPEETTISVKPATGITITPATLSIAHHAVATLKATVTPKDASQQVIWEVSDWVIPDDDKKTAPVTVSKYGIVEGVKPGTATITAKTSDGKFSATCAVTVNAVPVESVSLDITSKEIIEEDSFTLTATVNPSTATNSNVTWSSSNSDVASVEAGKVTGVSMGTAVITVTTEDGGKTASCTVSVKVRIPDSVEQVNIWRKDAAGYRAILGDDTDKTESFLSYSASGKVVTWTENTTGKPRSATIEFTNGSKLTVTQLEPKDFAGSWKYTGKTFASNKNLGLTANSNAYVANLTVAVADGTKASDGSREITNNLTVTGLINTYVAEACVDIDYDEKTYRFGFFFNGNKAQAVSTGKAGYDYIALLPELGSGWGSYNFCPFPFNGGTNYGWLWMVADSNEDGIDFTTSHYGRQNWYKCDGKDVLGLSFCACKSATPTVADFQAANATTYDVIYQCNVNTADNPGFELKRN